MTDSALVERPAPLDLALLKAVGLDRAAPEQRQLAIAIAERYGLDLMLKHLVLIDGRPYVTRDALLHIAHRSGQFDGIQTTTPEIVGDEWRCTATVWRKDMTHPFEYGGRYPTKGGNQKFAPEMAIKVAESMALRRAFNVAAPVAEERWDVEAPAEPPPVKPTLAERAAARAAEVEPPLVLEPMTPEASATEEIAIPKWDRDTVHDAAQKAGKGKAATTAYAEVADGRKVDELTAADWREIALRAGLE